MSKEIWLGADPDLHTTGLALADATFVYAVEIVRVEKKLKGADAVIAMCRAVRGSIARLVNDFYKAQEKIDRTRTHPVNGLVVEGQQLYLGGSAKKSKPNDLLNLACVTGSILGSFAPEQTLRPLPAEWKKQIPKEIHQARTAEHYGWHFQSMKDYVVPVAFNTESPCGAEGIDTQDWKHVMDAIGLARWGATRTTIERLEAEVPKNDRCGSCPHRAHSGAESCEDIMCGCEGG